jgi:hypothetical protein
VLRTIGWWALITGGLWVVLRFAVPAIAESVLPAGSSLIGGLATAVSESMLWPGLILVAVGDILFLGGSLIDWAERQKHTRQAVRPHEDLRWNSHAELGEAWGQGLAPHAASPPTVASAPPVASPPPSAQPATTEPVAPPPSVPVEPAVPVGAAAPWGPPATTASPAGRPARYIPDDITIVDQG